MMKVLVTGASGFIGRHTLPLLKQSGFDVVAISRHKAGHEDSIRWIQADLFKSDDVFTVMKDIQPTHILHFAWDVTAGKYWTSADNFRWVRASLTLLEAFQQNDGQRFVFAGTCAEYDWQYGYLTENVTPLNTNTPYAACKSSLYHMASSYAQQTGLSIGWGRIFFPFGSYENPARLIPYVVQSLLHDQPAETTSGEQIRDFIYVKDLASAFVSLLKSDVQGAINMASGDPIRLKHIIQSVADYLGKPDLIKLGARPENNDPPMIVGDVRRLYDEVGWQPQFTLEQGIEETILWWQSQLGK